ncbi:MAG TPA: response regulator [Terriglobales bacterium]|nr:response regulator [Terriglobales bacterium]
MSKPRNSVTAALRLQLLLVVEEEQDFRHLRDQLARAGEKQIRLDHARSYEEARKCLQKTTYDIVLCDYRSGDDTALRLSHEIRQHGPSVPVVFLSDHVDEATITRAIQAGACACVPASGLNESALAHAICYAIDTYCRERQRQKTEDMLRKLWHAVEQSADLVVITDRAGVMEYVNPAFESLTGYPREEAVGRTLRILRSEQQDPAVFQEMWRTILAGHVFRGTVANRKRNGEPFIVEKTITPLRDGNGEITHFISTDRDITDRRRLESDLQQAQKMDAIGRLAGGVAHDFNNLLMVISANAELMLEALVPAHPLRHKVEEIITAAGRASDLTRQLLAFGRKQMQSLRLLDLNLILSNIGRMLPRLIGEDIHLVMAPSARPAQLKADPVQIEQIVMNLAANARDAMPQGGTLTIEIANVRLDDVYVQRRSVVPPGDYVLLAVSDTGHGIAAEHLAHIFEPFYTTKEADKGTGLGLATVYGIVKQNGGFIWVYSEPGMGTTFKIYLPRAEEKVRESPVQPVAEKVPQGSETVLLVEDEPSVRESAREFLQLNGYMVLDAANGEEALRVAREYDGPIHLMITDVVMPNMGGAVLAEQLHQERPDMKVLFVSGYAEHTVLRHGDIDVTNQFLQKPFTLKSLARKAREVLQGGASSAKGASAG